MQKRPAIQNISSKTHYILSPKEETVNKNVKIESF
jgi:hypothetical protein